MLSSGGDRVRILLVEDDDSMREALQACLVQQHYTIDAVADGDVAGEYLSLYEYDLVVLDVQLPGSLDGISFCRQLRAEGYVLPVLLMSARDTSIDKIKGLDAGADDFVSKPFDIDVLEARIRALLRRGKTETTPILQWGELSLNPSQAEVTYGDRPIALTPKEYALLELFLRNSKQVLGYDKIMDSLWPAGEYPGKDTVRTHVKELRNKLQAAGAPADAIATVRGQGYRMKSQAVDVNEESAAIAISAAPTPTLASPVATRADRDWEADLAAEMAEVWEQNKERLLARWEAIAEAVQRLQQNAIDRELRERAIREAHTLAGTLGSFGFAEGARLAFELEALFVKIEFGNSETLDATRASLGETLAIALREEMEGSPSVRAERWVSGTAPLVVAIGIGADLARALLARAETAGWRLEVVSSELGGAIARELPTGVVVDMDWLRTAADEDREAIAALTRQTLPVPVVALGDRDRLDDRLEATRVGASTFLKTPVDAETAFAAVRQDIERRYAGSKVMVVDDDSQLLQGVATLLKPWGFKLSLVDDPLQFWPVLEAVRPDLVVLDVAMPQVNGIELCQILRSDPDWKQVPVVFLTAREESEIREQAFVAGADDYVRKPFVAAELANRILNRLSRRQS
ncbi:MAG: response regulator [Cyanobacteria bacterium J06639_1]